MAQRPPPLDRKRDPLRTLPLPAHNIGGSSTATLKVQTWVGRNHIVLDAWENYVRGAPKEVCPGK